MSILDLERSQMIRVIMRRNVFDHYTQLENHTTNALLTVLDANPVLFSKLSSKLKLGFKAQDFKVLAQRMPQKVANRNSVIDGTIFSEDYSHCIAIENKIVQGTIRQQQLLHHLGLLDEYEKSTLWILTPEKLSSLSLGQSKTRIINSAWPDIADALTEIGADKSNSLGHTLLREFVTFLERQPHMSHFGGFKFEYGFDEDLARTYTKKLTESLRPAMLSLYPRCKNTRATITGSWDAWFQTTQPQQSIHPGYSIHGDHVTCKIVLANKCREQWRSLGSKLSSNPDSFLKVLKKIYENSPKGSLATVSFRQRHYPS